jgi:hypothetical protein
MEDITLTDRGRVLTLRLTPDHNANLLRIVALHEDKEIGDVRLCWNDGLLYLDAYDTDDVADKEAVPGLDMHVLWSCDA